MTQQNDGQITVTDEQRSLPLSGLQVEDGILVIQVLERLAESGRVKGAELYPLGMLRERVVQSIAHASQLQHAGLDDEKEIEQPSGKKGDA